MPGSWRGHDCSVQNLSPPFWQVHLSVLPAALERFPARMVCICQPCNRIQLWSEWKSDNQREKAARWPPLISDQKFAVHFQFSWILRTVTTNTYTIQNHLVQYLFSLKPDDSLNLSCVWKKTGDLTVIDILATNTVVVWLRSTISKFNKIETKITTLDPEHVSKYCYRVCKKRGRRVSSSTYFLCQNQANLYFQYQWWTYFACCFVWL